MNFESGNLECPEKIKETKKRGNGIKTIKNFIDIFSGILKYNTAKIGVTIVDQKKCKSKIPNWTAHNEIIIITFDTNVAGQYSVCTHHQTMTSSK